MITQIGDMLKVRFEHPYDIGLYKVFLQSKQLPEYNLEYNHENDSYVVTCPVRFAKLFGMNDIIPDYGFLPPNPALFDYQEYIAYTHALPLKRYAMWLDTGLGKTIIMLELARQVKYKTGGRVLLIIPLNIIPQTIGEALKFYGEEYEIEPIKSREHLKMWCKLSGPGIGIINPDKFIPRKKAGDQETISECQYLAGVLLDEASILKSGGGTIKWALIKSCKGIEYKYTFTATPAPNEVMEFASQASFLEKLRDENEIIWTYFKRNKDGEWSLRDYAERDFYKFMAGWSVYLRSPARYGFADNLKDLPPPVVREYHIPMTEAQQNYVGSVPDNNGQLSLFASSENTKLDMTQRIKFSEIAKGFLYSGSNGSRKSERIASNKPGFVRDLAQADLDAGRQSIIWTVFDEESDIIAEQLSDCGHDVRCLTGKVPKAKRGEIIEDFRKGNLPCLITKAQLLGYGLNFQNCTSNIISGFNDSEEQRYQLERRSYRYGQKNTVYFHYPYIPEMEGVVYNNINRKRDRIAADVAMMEGEYIKVMKEMERRIDK